MVHPESQQLSSSGSLPPKQRWDASGWHACLGWHGVEAGEAAA